MTETNASPTGRILVVDDNEMNRDLLSRRLLRQGHAVETAVDGRDALERIRSEAFDLVLLDIMMPEMNGYELLERLKGDPVHRDVPVIMITAIDDMDSVARCIEMGAEDHLPKPFNPTVLRARIDSSLAKKRLRDREQLHLQSLERELEIGRQIQRGFLPETLPRVEGWELAARFQPARQVAGDFYDAFPLAGGRVGLLVADVCDKGVGAALFMALFRSLIRMLAQQPRDAAAPAALLRHTLSSVSDYIADTHDGANMFATVFFAVLEPGAGVLHYLNAGHDPPVVASRDGAVSRLAPTGPALGMLPGLEFATAHATLAPGDLLVAFTDGVIDARGADGAPFTEDRLVGLLREPGLSARDALDRVTERVGSHMAGAEQFDDITLLALRHA